MDADSINMSKEWNVEWGRNIGTIVTCVIPNKTGTARNGAAHVTESVNVQPFLGNFGLSKGKFYCIHVSSLKWNHIFCLFGKISLSFFRKVLCKVCQEEISGQMTAVLQKILVFVHSKTFAFIKNGIFSFTKCNADYW